MRRRKHVVSMKPLPALRIASLLSPTATSALRQFADAHPCSKYAWFCASCRQNDLELPALSPPSPFLFQVGSTPFAGKLLLDSSSFSPPVTNLTWVIARIETSRRTSGQTAFKYPELELFPGQGNATQRQSSIEKAAFAARSWLVQMHRLGESALARSTLAQRWRSPRVSRR